MTDTQTQIRPPADGRAGFSMLAKIMSAWYQVPIDPRQVRMWFIRRTRNARGEPFPAPATVQPAWRNGQDRNLFSVRQVIEWYDAGMPETNPNQHTEWGSDGQQEG